MAIKTILYIDGENFLFKVADILKEEGKITHKSEIKKFSLSILRSQALSEFDINETRFYAAKVHLHRDDPILEQKSRDIIESQRRLKRSIERDGNKFILSGHVRLQDIIPGRGNSRARYIFKEKGTDVRLAIDALADSCDGNVDTILLMSSDSDMQPMVSECLNRGRKVVYIGFENKPNLGLSNKCSQTILLRKKEILEAYEGNQKELA